MLLRQAQPKPDAVKTPQEIETRESPVVSADARLQAPSRLQLALDYIVPFLQQSVQYHMPPSAFKDFYLWGLDASNPYHDTWISLIGLKRIVQFTLQSVAAPFKDTQIPTFALYAAPMSIYLTFEVVSDNLEFGLNERDPRDRTHYLRAHLIREFTYAMCMRLKGSQATAASLLSREELIARRISTYHQSLNPEKHRLISDAYLRQYAHASSKELDAGLLPQLIMNIESANDLVRQTCSHQTADLIHMGLYRRYRSAERIYRDPNLSLARIVSHGAYTILLIPVLAYYLEMGANALGVADRLRTTIANGTLARALYQCSVLVRLLNDLGTPIVMQSPEQRYDLMTQLRSRARQNGAGNIRTFLRKQVSGQLDRSLLNRIAKDVETGEFNIALYNLPHINPLDQALLTFGDRLDALSRIYHRTDADFRLVLNEISDTLGTDTISKMIRSVVDFHFTMYNHDYREAEGDFAN